MRGFADLYAALDATTSTNAKVEAMEAYFAAAPPEDAAWAAWFLSGRRPKRLVRSTDLRAWATEASGVPDWLFEESYAAVGDLAETVALLLDRPRADGGGPGADADTGAGGRRDGEDIASRPLSAWLEDHLLPLRRLSPDEQRERVIGWWRALPRRQTFLLNKLLTGGFRVGVSQTLVARALAGVAGIPPAAVAHRLMGHWEPTPTFFRTLLAGEAGDVDLSRPYPFFLASPLPDEPETALGPREDWLAEWKWDGIRAQMIRRGGAVFLWSRGEELITDRFPELSEAAKLLPDGTVLDGEVMAWSHAADAPLPFALLQKRIGRKRLTERVLRDAPAAFLAYDLLEAEEDDLRRRPLAERRSRLAALLGDAGGSLGPRPRLLLSPEVAPATSGVAAGWARLAALREEARERGVEGLVLKRLDSPYRTGRKRGDWWKWKVDPFTVDAVLIYAQAGHGRRANLFTDYTFAVWHEGELVPIAKAYSGLTDEEILRLDGWIRRHTRERFGPVRSVEPVQVFEIAFGNIRPSKRHKSGLAVRFPRIARWRTDKPAAEADHLETLRELLDAVG